MKQLSAGRDTEQKEIVAIAGEVKVEQSQQRRQESLLIATETGIINESSSIRYRAFYEK